MKMYKPQMILMDGGENSKKLFPNCLLYYTITLYDRVYAGLA